MKSRVFSIRLSLDALQSCKDFLASQQIPITTGEGGIVAKYVELTTLALRSQGTLPTRTVTETISLNRGSARFCPSSIDEGQLPTLAQHPLNRNQVNIQNFNINLDDEVEDDVYKSELEKAIQLQQMEEDIDLLSKLIIGG